MIYFFPYREKGEFIMQISTWDEKMAKDLKGDMYAYRGLLNMDNPIKQNFKLEYNEKEGKVIVSGNLFNALNILKKFQLISTQFANTILADTEVKTFLNKTKDFVLPKNQVKDESTESDEEYISSLEVHVNDLEKLDLEGQKTAKAAFDNLKNTLS